MSFFCYELERERDALTHLVYYYKTKWEQAEERAEKLQERIYILQCDSKILKQALDE